MYTKTTCAVLALLFTSGSALGLKNRLRYGGAEAGIDMPEDHDHGDHGNEDW